MKPWKKSPLTALLKKLNLKAQESMVVVNARETFEPELRALQRMTGIAVQRKISKGKSTPFAIAFAVTQKQLDQASTALCKAIEADSVLWIAYPKGTSKRYHGDFNRDTGWHVLAQAGFEPVRKVAIDEDWSALRFRRVEFIKSMTRKRN